MLSLYDFSRRVSEHRWPLEDQQVRLFLSFLSLFVVGFLASVSFPVRHNPQPQRIRVGKRIIGE
jgi:hypothetical protein